MISEKSNTADDPQPNSWTPPPKTKLDCFRVGCVEANSPGDSCATLSTDCTSDGGSLSDGGSPSARCLSPLVYGPLDDSTSDDRSVEEPTRQPADRKRAEKEIALTRQGTPTRRRLRADSMEATDSMTLDLEEGSQHNLEPTSSSPAEPLILFGYDITHLPPSLQFFLCAAGVFGFTIIYGYLQELLSVHIAGRKFGLFLGTCQFAGYTFWSFVLTQLRSTRFKKSGSDGGLDRTEMVQTQQAASVPFHKYVGLSIVRAVDLGMTNLAMQVLNYPAKTLIKSSRVVFTMLLGLVIGRKRYKTRDYVAVVTLVIGLGIFLHADSTSSAVFHPIGVAMLVVSLTCDGAVNNWSELIMNRYSVGHDHFQFRMYSVALIAMMVASHLKNELIPGVRYFFLTPGTVSEIESGRFDHDPTTWTVPRKLSILLLFSMTGLFGSSCAGAITKRFGALCMSITSTARKGATLFLSFAAFPNKCTVEHVVGIVLFLSALVMKSLSVRASKMESNGKNPQRATTDSLKLKESFADSDEEDEEEDRPLLEVEIGDNLFEMARRSRRMDELLNKSGFRAE